MSLAQSLSIIALLVSVLSAAIAWRIGMRTLRITTYRSATDLMLEVDRVFIGHPKLRPYFYENVACPPGHAHYNLVQAVAELELDVLECIWDGRDSYSEDDRDSWAKYIKDTVDKSPALRQMHADPAKADWYPTLDELLTAGAHAVAPQPGWLSRARQLTGRLLGP
jgi:hypothetical protein